MKKGILLYIISALIIFTTACSNDLDNKNNKNNKSDFKSDINSILDLVNNSGISGVQKSYVIHNKYMVDDSQMSYDISDYDIEIGLLYKNENDKVYASLENDESCAIKDFDDNDFTIYDISEKDKCHKFYLLGNDINLVVIPVNIETNEAYVQGTVSNNYISLLVQENILDDGAINYKWYRNDEEISDSSVRIYTITSDFEDADYYVEILTNDGQSFKSEPVNVKIDRR